MLDRGRKSSEEILAASEDTYRVDKKVGKKDGDVAINVATVGKKEIDATERKYPQAIENARLLQETKSPREISQGLKVPPAGVQGESADPVKTRTKRDLTSPLFAKSFAVRKILELIEGLSNDEFKELIDVLTADQINR